MPATQGRVAAADVLVNNADVMLLGPFAADQGADYRQMILDKGDPP